VSPRLLGALVGVLALGIGAGVLLASHRTAPIDAPAAGSSPTTADAPPGDAPPGEPEPDDTDDGDTEDDDDDLRDDAKVEMQAKAKICKKLSCTEAQRGELGTAIRQFRDETRERRIEIRNLRASAAELWRTEAPDPARVTELETRLLQLEGEVEASARGALLTFHRLLDELQRRKLAKWLRRKSARDLLSDRRPREQGEQ
jgi:uncharacterized membrane protein